MYLLYSVNVYIFNVVIEIKFYSSILVFYYATVFIIVSLKLTASSVIVKNALQFGKDCMEAYEIKLSQGLYNKISTYVVSMDTTMEEGLTRE